MRMKRLTALALAMLLLLTVPAAWAAPEGHVDEEDLGDLIVYDDSNSVFYEEEAPAAPQGSSTPAAVPVNTPPPLPAAVAEETPAQAEAEPEAAESEGPPAVLAQTPDPDASPTIAPPPTPAPTLPVTPDKEMPAPAADAKAEAIVTAAEGTAMFELPSHESSILANLNSGAVLTVKILGLGWTKVDNAGQEGYVPTYTLSFGYGSPQPALAVVTAPGGKLTLREKMTTKSKALGSVPSGRALVLLAKGKTFSLVRHEAKEGYVLTAHLEERPAEQNLGTLTQVVAIDGKTTANVRLRAKADRRAPYYTSVKSGNAVVVKDIQNDWASVEYEGYHGFMMGEYLKRFD